VDPWAIQQVEGQCGVSAGSSTAEHRPAELVSQPLILQDEFANRIRKLFAPPAALDPAGPLTLVSGAAARAALIA